MPVAWALALHWTIPIHHLHVAFYEVRVCHVSLNQWFVALQINWPLHDLLNALFLRLLDILP